MIFIVSIPFDAFGTMLTNSCIDKWKKESVYSQLIITVAIVAFLAHLSFHVRSNSNVKSISIVETKAKFHARIVARQNSARKMGFHN